MVKRGRGGQKIGSGPHNSDDGADDDDDDDDATDDDGRQRRAVDATLNALGRIEPRCINTRHSVFQREPVLVLANQQQSTDRR